MIFDKVKKFIYGKSLHHRELIETHATIEEKNKRVVMAISMYLVPFLYTYLFLIINNGIKDNKIFLYLPVLVIWFYIRRMRIKYELNVLNNCVEREATKE